MKHQIWRHVRSKGLYYKLALRYSMILTEKKKEKEQDSSDILPLNIQLYVHHYLTKYLTCFGNNCWTISHTNWVGCVQESHHLWQYITTIFRRSSRTDMGVGLVPRYSNPLTLTLYSIKTKKGGQIMMKL